MATFDSIEQSVQSGAPRELFVFTAPTTTWRMTSGDNDITFGGNVYTAATVSRADLAGKDALVITIPASHDLAKTYVNGLPPKDLLLTLTRYHAASGVSAQVWKGYATGIEYRMKNGAAVALITVPDFLATALACDVSGVIASRVCNHILFDAQCQAVQSSFQVTTTISAISADGLTITTASSVPAAVKNVDWSLHGALQHVASGETRTVISQVALNQFLLDAPLPNNAPHVGDSVLVIAGCNKSLDQCESKFLNALNFGGMPVLPVSNIFYVGLVNALYHQYQP